MFGIGIRNNVVLAADLSVASTIVAQNIPGFAFTVPAGSAVTMRMFGMCFMPATGGYAFSATLTGGAMAFGWSDINVFGAAASGASYSVVFPGVNSDPLANAGNCKVSWEGSIVNPATALTVQLTFSQQNAQATPSILYQGTTLEWFVWTP